MSDKLEDHSPIEKDLHLEYIDVNLYRSASTLWKPPGARGVFGGAVISQALRAAMSTVDEAFVIHSLHSYFVLPGDGDLKVIYHVERVRDGKTYATRTVKASQKGRCIYTVTCSFQRPEESDLHHTTPIPEDVPTVDELMSDKQLAELIKQSDMGKSEDGKRMSAALRETTPIEYRRVLNDDPTMHPSERTQLLWVRAKGSITGGWSSHAMAMAYFSDSSFLMTSARVNDKLYDIKMAASLDHSIYFHAPFRADEWLLYVMESPWSGSGRGLNYGRLYTQKGEHVASTIQEGVLRLGRKGAKKESKL